VDFIKANLKSTIMVAFVVLMLVQIILPTFYDIVTSAIEIGILYFVLFKSGLFKTS
jgi:hypothetical protein